MVNKEEQVENKGKKAMGVDDVIVVPTIETDLGSEPATTLFAVRTLDCNN